MGPHLNCASEQSLFCGGIVPTVQIGTLGAVGTWNWSLWRTALLEMSSEGNSSKVPTAPIERMMRLYTAYHYSGLVT
jgi:hypothetical protein